MDVAAGGPWTAEYALRERLWRRLRPWWRSSSSSSKSKSKSNSNSNSHAAQCLLLQQRFIASAGHELLPREAAGQVAGARAGGAGEHCSVRPPCVAACTWSCTSTSFWSSSVNVHAAFAWRALLVCGSTPGAMRGETHVPEAKPLESLNCSRLRRTVRISRWKRAAQPEARLRRTWSWALRWRESVRGKDWGMKVPEGKCASTEVPLEVM